MADLAALKAEHPEWNIVDVVDAPGGGQWALGTDGGVFALGGAKFLGSYFTIDPRHRNDPNRRFSAIQVNDKTGGYDLVTSNAERYGGDAFADPEYVSQRQRETATPPAAGQPGATTADANKTVINNLLTRLNLGGLFDAAWQQWTGMGGTASVEAINLWLREQPSFQQRFPAIKQLEAQNIYWTPGQYLAYEDEVKTKMASAGIPADFYEESDIAELAVNRWSADEIGDAINQAAAAVHTMPAEVRDTMQRYYGIGPGDLTAFYLDPDKKGNDLIERKAMTAIAGIGGAVGKSDFGALSQEEAARLYRGGLSGEQAAQGLGATTALLGETAGETTDLTRETALGAVTGTAADQQALSKRLRSRQAAFSGGGGAAGGGQGGTGLGSGS